MQITYMISPEITRVVSRQKVSRWGKRGELLSRVIVMVFSASRPHQQYFSYIVSVSFIGGGNHSTRRKPRPTAYYHIISNTARHERDSILRGDRQCLPR